MKRTLFSLLLTLLTIPAFAHVWEVRVNQAQDGTLTWYLQSYHAVSECGIGNSGLVINGVQYAMQQIFAGDAATQSPTVFAVNASYNNPAYRTSYAQSYATIHTPFLGTTLSVYPYSNNQCWDNLVSGSGNFTPPPPPVCTSCPVTSWTNTTSTASNNGTACNPTDDILSANIAVNHLSCGSITGDGQFRVVFDPSGANVSYGPFTYASGIVTNVSVSLPYGTSNSTQLQVIDDDYPCSVVHGLVVPGGQFNGVVDNVSPVVSCPGNITLNVNPGECGAMANFSATATDNCGTATIAYSQNPGTLFPVGVTTVTATATDAANNVSTPCSFTVTVVDNQLPVVNCPPNVTVSCDASTDVIATGSATATDPCGIASLTYADVSTQDANVNNAGHYNYTIARTWSATDAHNNSASCVHAITVNDVTAPVTIAQNVTVNLNAAGNVTVNASDINNGSSDNCSPVTVGLQTTTGIVPSLSFDCSNVGANTITLVATDVTGNTSTATAIVTVVDNTAPVVATQGATVQLDANGVASVTATAVDNGSTDVCGIQSMTVSPNSFTCGNVGANPVILTVTDVNGNVSTGTATVTVEDLIAPVVVTPADITVGCDGLTSTAATGMATATDACGVASVTNADVSTQDANANNAGHYNYTIARTWTATDVNSNVTTTVQNITVQDVNAPSIIAPVDVTVSCDGSTATTATGIATGSDNCSPVAITNADVSTQDANANNAGHYNYSIARTWTATDATGNATSSVQTITVQDVTAPVITCPASVTVSCQADPATTGTATATDVCSPVTVTYADASTYDASLTSANHYNYVITRTWTATDVTGNASTCAQTINVQQLHLTAVTTPILCYGNNTGAVNLTVQGGIAPLTYSWSNAATTEDVAALVAGTYSVTVTDAAGCQANDTYILTQPVAPVTAAIAVSPVQTVSGQASYTVFIGYGPQSVTLSASATGGAAGYTYSWSPTTGVANPTSATTLVTPSATTNYTVTITDANGCVETSSQTIYVNNVSCGNNDNKVQVCHKSKNCYHGWWSWYACNSNCYNTNTICVSVNAVAAHLAHGDYLGQCLEANGNTTHVVCNGDSTGAINLTVAGGIPPYSYSWSNGATTEDITGLAAGNYTVTVTAADARTEMVNFTVNQSSAIVVNSNINNACFGVNSGSVNVSVNGGSHPYTYLWNNAATTQDRYNLAGGTYSITVKDHKGCIATETFTVLESTTPIAITGVKTNVTCKDGENGSIDITVTGGAGPYTYSWDEDNNSNSYNNHHHHGNNNWWHGWCNNHHNNNNNNQTTQDLTDLDEGTYVVTVTDANGCTSTATFTITEPATGVSASIAVSPAVTVSNCQPYTIYIGYGAQSVTLTGNGTGGAAPYTYSWSASGFTTTAGQSVSVSPTATKTYTLTVTDANGCTKTTTRTIKVEDVRSYNEKIMLCHNGHTQSVSVNSVQSHLNHGDNLGSCHGHNKSDGEEVAPVENKDLTGITISDVKIYPNPNTGTFTIEVPADLGKVEIAVMDMAGKVIMKKSMEFGNTIQINLGDASRGVYMIHVTSGDQNFRTNVLVQ